MRIGVVIPCYRVAKQILNVIGDIGPEVEKIYVVDDRCPEESGLLVQKSCKDPRVKVFFHAENYGVGGSVKTGWKAGYSDGMEILVKLDGDGQMDPRLIPALVEPIETSRADYTKGNRFFTPRGLSQMPLLRLIGNAGISLLAKLTSGYWQVMDPTNGFIAIHSSLLPFLEIQKLHNRYFFENDVLFRVGLLRGAVQDVPMLSRYLDEHSNLSVLTVLFTFPWLFLFRFYKRIIYRYFLRDFNAASILMLLGKPLALFGITFGTIKWQQSIHTGIVATSGTVMLAALPLLFGVFMLLFAFLFDVSTVPTVAVFPTLHKQLKQGLKTEFPL